MTECEDVPGRETRTTWRDRYLQERGTCKLSALKGVSFTPLAKSKFLGKLSEAFDKKEHGIARQCLCTLTTRVKIRGQCLPSLLLCSKSDFHGLELLALLTTLCIEFN